MINIGTLELADIAVGSTSIEKAYLGSTLVWEKSSPVLPYDAQVEWLATDGVSYIDTGFKPKNTTRFEIVMDVPVLEQDTWFFGSRSSASAGYLALLYDKANTRWIWRFGNKSTNGTNTPSAGQYTFDNYNTSYARRISITNGTTITLTSTSNTFTGSANFYIFTLNLGDGSPTSAMQNGLKCISAKIWDGTTLVRDYIPVRKNGVGYLWDKVTETLYGNANSVGEFTYGNDVT